MAKSLARVMELDLLDMWRGEICGKLARLVEDLSQMQQGHLSTIRVRNAALRRTWNLVALGAGKMDAGRARRCRRPLVSLDR